MGKRVQDADLCNRLVSTVDGSDERHCHWSVSKSECQKHSDVTSCTEISRKRKCKHVTEGLSCEWYQMSCRDQDDNFGQTCGDFTKKTECHNKGAEAGLKCVWWSNDSCMLDTDLACADMINETQCKKLDFNNAVSDNLSAPLDLDCDWVGSEDRSSHSCEPLATINTWDCSRYAYTDMRGHCEANSDRCEWNKRRDPMCFGKA